MLIKRPTLSESGRNYSPIDSARIAKVFPKIQKETKE
jgi:hypothetical protein